MTDSRHNRKPPQKRIRTRETIAQPNLAEYGAEVIPPPSMERLIGILRMGTDKPTNDPMIHLSRSIFKDNLGPDDDVSALAEPRAICVAKAIVDAHDFLENQGVSLLNDAEWGAWSKRQKSIVMRKILDRGTSMEDEDATIMDAVFGLYLGVVMADKNTAGQMLLARQSKKAMAAFSTEEAGAEYLDSKAGLFRAIENDPRKVRRDIEASLKELTDSSFREFIDDEFMRIYETASVSDGADVVSEMYGFAGQKLDYTILPQGTTLHEYSELLCGGLTPSDAERVDLRRLGVLHELRERIGEDRTYYVHGKPRGSLADPRGERINEAYLGLVVQHHDDGGRVVGEDCVVVSPVTRRHAAFVVRGDVSSEAWREVLKVPKSSSREMGARQVKFSAPDGADLYDVMVKKFLLLLNCPPDKFNQSNEFAYRSGEFALRTRPERPLGQAALNGLA